MDKQNKFANKFYKRPEDLKQLPFIMSIICMMGGFACVAFAFLLYYVGIVISAAVIVGSLLTLRKEKNLASYAGLTLSVLSFILSLAILLINTFLF